MMEVIGATCLVIGTVLLAVFIKNDNTSEEMSPDRERKHTILHITALVFQLIGTILMLVAYFR